MKTKLLLFFFIPFLSFSQVLKGSLISGISSTNSARAFVALSSDGNILVASGPYNGAGLTKVYKFENNDWVQLGGVTGHPYSVSISSDGTIIAGGSIKAGNLDNGTVGIYKYVNDNWVLIGSQIQGKESFDEFGYKVALSSDGTIVAASAILNDINGSKSGHVRVFKNINDVWTQIGSDINGDAAADKFGTDITLSSDGTIIGIGTPLNDVNGTSSGQVKIFKNINNIWTQIGTDLLGDAAGNKFGESISMSSDGTSIVIAAPTTTGSTFPSENSYCKVYENINDVWIQKGSKITDIQRDAVVSMSGDGKFIVVKKKNGFAHIYEFKNNDWEEIGVVSRNTKLDFHLSKDANTLALGLNQSRALVEVYDLSGLTLGVNDFVNYSTKIFPNPVKKVLSIELKNNLLLKQVIIYNQLGKKIISTLSSKIDISMYQKGIYFTKIITNKGFTFKKIIKN
ncbi:MAG: T9SS type A sorting domain-containing protein [Polaribacter sp.]|uniref:T9SS type A sorting domain-containing protein n=1 Tax=Polaribacter sp. TaxID=1920175 RepID=UPI002F3565BD